MTITVRFFASIRENLGKSEDRVSCQGIEKAADVWQQCAAVPAPANMLVAINQEYAGLHSPVRDGDEVAFFPPVTGGAVTPRGRRARRDS